MITIEGVTKRYGARTALANVSLTVDRGEIALLLGANGAGKSTLLRCVLGATAFDGRIRVDGRDPITDGPAVRSVIGYMPQSGGLHPDLTVLETLRFYADVRRVPHAGIAALIEDARLGAHTTARVADLSGGLRQRLGFALALLPDPEILILDEPSASLDATSHLWLAARLRALAAAGRTVLVSTHASQALREVADRTITLEDGVIVGALSVPSVQSDAIAGPSREPDARAPVRAAIAPIAWKELRDAGRNRWLLAYAATLGVLGIAATATAIDSVSGLTLDAFGRTTATLMNLCLLLSPLVAILMGAGAIAGEQERGTLDHLLALPVSRTELLLAKHAGLVLALAVATLAGFLPAGVLIAYASGGTMLGDYLLFPLLALFGAAAMSGIGVLVSVASRSAVQAQGTAVVVWFAFALLYDLLLVGSLAMSGLPPEWLAAALVANPIDATRVLGVLALEPDLYMLGPAGAFLTARLAPVGTAVLLTGSLVAWTVMPVVAAIVMFSFPLRRQSYDSTRLLFVRGLGRARGHDRVRVGGGIAGV